MIIHRDLKPANLMIAGVPFENGSREVAQKSGFVKIADFGLSRSLAINNPHSKTSAHKEIESDRSAPSKLCSLYPVSADCREMSRKRLVHSKAQCL